MIVIVGMTELLSTTEVSFPAFLTTTFLPHLGIPKALTSISCMCTQSPTLVERERSLEGVANTVVGVGREFNGFSTTVDCR